VKDARVYPFYAAQACRRARGAFHIGVCRFDPAGCHVPLFVLFACGDNNIASVRNYIHIKEAILNSARNIVHVLCLAIFAHSNQRNVNAVLCNCNSCPAVRNINLNGDSLVEHIIVKTVGYIQGD
jgi:hypothetical protein